MDKDFLLKNKAAKKLYHDYAAKLPVIDYHCHLSPQQIAEDKHYSDITEVWLGGDHYKWRAMRGCGVEEKYITGDATPHEKFLKWAEVMPYCIGNPLYHWTHLELQRYFGVYEPLCPESAERIWNKCNELLARPDFGARGLIKRSNVEIICTTDDPIDDLAHHKAIADDASFDVKVLPTFRPDKALKITAADFAEYIMKLFELCGEEEKTVSSLKRALAARIAFFAENGCRISDHSLETVSFDCDPVAAETALLKALSGEAVSDYEASAYRTELLLFLGEEYAKRDWAMQVHLAALRDNNTAMFEKIGVDTGYDAISDMSVIVPIRDLLDALEKKNMLPKTVLYTLNPCHNEAPVALATCFNGHGVAGKMQFGSGWWFNDQQDGMKRQMTALSSIGILSKFVGMLTDSRSFLSYTRHEYFRRIVCNMIGTWADEGEIPCDYELLGKIVSDISYFNTKNYFFK